MPSPGIFPTQGWNPDLPHCRQILQQLSHWSGLPFPPPGDLPDPGIELRPPTLRALSLSHWTTREVPYVCTLKAPSPPNTFLHASLARFGYMPFPRLVTEKVKVAQSCPTFCNPMVDTVPGILQTRILEWVAFAFSRDLPNPGIKLRSSTLQADLFTR